MATAPSKPTPTSSRSAPPPLESGDRLSWAEFERRYEAMPEVKKAELVDGVVIMGSPVRMRSHGRPHAHVLTWLGTFESVTPGVFVADNASARLDLDNEPQPDALLMIEPSAGGQARIAEDDYIEGAPELVVEVASSSVSFDLHAKLNAYRRAGVREYVVWRVLDGAVDWLEQDGGRFAPRPAGQDGLHRSAIFPGLWLDAAAMLRGDLSAVLDGLRRGLDGPEHAAFVDRLRAAADVAGR